MRMISQSLREEQIDYSEPVQCTRPWIRRKAMDVAPELDTRAEAQEVAQEVERGAVLHVSPEQV